MGVVKKLTLPTAYMTGPLRPPAAMIIDFIQPILMLDALLILHRTIFGPAIEGDVLNNMSVAFLTNLIGKPSALGMAYVVRLGYLVSGACCCR